MSFRAENWESPLVLPPAWEDFPGDNTSGGPEGEHEAGRLSCERNKDVSFSGPRPPLDLWPLLEAQAAEPLTEGAR